MSEVLASRPTGTIEVTPAWGRDEGKSLMSASDRSYFHKGGPIGFLLVHGLGGTPVELRYVAQGLARAGHSVHCCQLAGHCGSTDQLRRSTWRQWFASVEAAHDRLRPQCETVIVGGLSMGAVLALHLAHQRPEGIDGLALYAPSLRLDGWSMPWYSFLLSLFRPYHITIDVDMPEHEPYGLKDERIRAFVLKSMLGTDSSQAGTFSTPIRAFAQFNALAAIVRRELSDIAVPALILHPRDDDMADLGNALEIQRKLRGPTETVVLDDSYHLITLDRQRQVVVDRSLEFTARIASRTRPADVLARRRLDRQPVRQSA